MKKIIILSLLFISSIIAFSQEDVNVKNDELQNLLDDYHIETGNGNKVSIRKINEHIATFEEVKRERDSLEMLVELLKADLLVAKGKLTSCEFFKEKIEQTALNSANYEQINVDGINNLVITNTDGSTNGTHAIEKGSYVIIESERTKEDIQKKLVAFQKKFPGYELMVIQNKIQTWFHVCLVKKFSTETVGQRVHEMRKEGVYDAWSMLLE